MPETSEKRRSTLNTQPCGTAALNGIFWFGYYYFTWPDTGFGGNNN